MKSSSTQVTCQDIKGKKYSVPSQELVFRPAIYSIIIQDDKILLSKQWDGYDFPGGGIELGESLKTALVRETKEETGFEVEVGDILHANHSFFKMPQDGSYVHSIHLYYQCQIVGGELSTEFFDDFEKEYADQAEWIPLEKVTQIKFYGSVEVQEVLKDFLKP